MMLLCSSKTAQGIPALRISFCFGQGDVREMAFHLRLPVGLNRG
jgi:hypothetical protein